MSTRHVCGAAGAFLVVSVLVAARGGVRADIIEPWLPCPTPNDCALPWMQRDREGVKWSLCWREPWCRNWLEEVIASTRPGKRDIFMSRGWGAGGMPFSVLYLNSHLRLKQQQQKLRDQLLLEQQQQQQQQHHREQREQGSARQPRFSPLEADAVATAHTEALVSEQQDYGDSTGSEPSTPPQRIIPHKQYAVLPQLFISYGWGPLG
ncbi:hypothetical protein B566_EDAN016598 [Ephemera danica]|nr:hypothetical protein B566_EDAN016876 [Ephemera danica]KAF4528117.1 hypothetical protein B566_EDAN016598 [Ephemera danica]